MSFHTLSAFIDELDRRGDLKRVRREVDWKYEVTEIACREAKNEGPALLFENVRGAQFPLAVNVLAASRRIEWALGRTPASVGAVVVEHQRSGCTRRRRHWVRPHASVAREGVYAEANRRGR